MGRKAQAVTVFGISVITLLLIYQILNAAGDFAQTVLGWNVPEWYYGILALGFIFIAFVMLIKRPEKYR